MDLGLDNEFESDDSFFDDPKISKKAKPTKATDKKSLDDIFGFEEDKKLEKSGQSSLENIVPSGPVAKPKVRFNVEDTATNENPRKAPESVKSNTLDWLGGSDDVAFPKKIPLATRTNPKTDILGDVLSTTPPKSDSKKPFDLLDDILPQRSRKMEQAKTTSFEDIFKDSKAQKSGPSSLEKSSEDKIDQALRQERGGVGQKAFASSSEGLSMILEPPQGSRRGRRGSNAGVADALGLFGSGPPSSEFLGVSKPSSMEERRGTSKSLGKDIPDWLGDSSTTVNKSEATISLENIPQKAAESEMKIETGPPNTQDIPQNITQNNPEPPTHSFQSNMSNLQTQESFLLVSLQLKKYEENLLEIKDQQHEILRKQESQFDMFLNKYIDKQKSIEQEMLAQQDRINEHIRMMALRGFEGASRFAKDAHKGQDEEETGEHVVLDKIVQSLKQRHDEEFFLMEESYKKQISLLEKSSDQIEHRLNQDIQTVAKTYEEKLESLRTQHSDEIKYWTEKIKNIDEKYKEEIENMKENHTRVIREVKDEFLDQFERFKEQRGRESDLFANSADITQKLSVSLEKLGRNEEVLEHIQEKVVSDYSVFSMARERSIENKEKDITAMRIALEKCRDQAEKDRSQLLALIRTLEQKISEQNQNSQEERWALQQAAATIAARSAAFDREVEFSRASIEREREQLKTLKEALLAEQERATMQLTEEKLKLTAEKSKLDVSAKLVNTYEVEKIKTEAETAIQVAKELTQKLNLERNFVQRQKAELESFRNKLMEKEREMLEREENVEEMRRSIQQKNNEDRRIIQETKFLENRYKEKLSELQSQAMSLSSREKKLAEEKLLISKERLALYTSIKSQADHKRCMLCKAEEEKSSKNEALFLGYPASDPEFIRFRIDATEEDRNSEVSREDTLLSSHIKQ